MGLVDKTDLILHLQLMPPSLKDFLFFQNFEVTHIKQFHPFFHPSQLHCAGIVLGESYYRPQPPY